VSQAVKKLKEESTRSHPKIKKEKTPSDFHSNERIRKPDRKKVDKVTGKKLRHRDRQNKDTSIQNSFEGESNSDGIKKVKNYIYLNDLKKPFLSFKKFFGLIFVLVYAD